MSPTALLASIDAVRSAVVALLCRVSQDTTPTAVFVAGTQAGRARNAARGDYGEVVCSIVATPDGRDATVVLSTHGGRPDRLARLGFIPDPTYDGNAVFIGRILTIDTPTNIARRIVDVLEFAHGAPGDARVHAREASTRPGATGTSVPDVRRSALVDLADRPDDSAARRAFSSRLDGWTWHLSIRPGTGNEPEFERRLLRSISPQTTDACLVIPVALTADTVDAADTVSVPARDLLRWAAEHGGTPLLLDPTGPAPFILDHELVAALLQPDDEHAPAADDPTRDAPATQPSSRATRVAS